MSRNIQDFSRFLGQTSAVNFSHDTNEKFVETHSKNISPISSHTIRDTKIFKMLSILQITISLRISNLMKYFTLSIARSRECFSMIYLQQTHLGTPSRRPVFFSRRARLTFSALHFRDGGKAFRIFPRVLHTLAFARAVAVAATAFATCPSSFSHSTLNAWCPFCAPYSASTKGTLPLSPRCTHG